MAPSEPYLGYYPEAELVFAFVCAIGTNYEPVVDAAKDYLKLFGYETNVIHVSDRFQVMLQALGEDIADWPQAAADRMKSKIAAGNRVRELTQKKEIMALLVAEEIERLREYNPQDGGPKPLPRTAHLVLTLKRPEEVESLRRIYGAGFYLIGIASTRDEQQDFLEQRRGLVSDAEREELIEIDANESAQFGQQTRDTFYLSDVFVSLRDHEGQLRRFLDLVFGCPTETPSLDEHAMYMAYAASLRSGDLSRQVGAALVDAHGDLLAVGCNDVPRFGGGLYWPGPNANRDIEKKFDANDAEKMDMAAKIMVLLEPSTPEPDRRERARATLRPTGFFDITEFGRAVHAEMEALLACARTGRSPREAVLYTTTFPCHNCTRHVIAAGVRRVVYIEPYAKSKAFVLHDDAISAAENTGDRLPFVPFLGVGPRRYLDLFSMTLGTGTRTERKQDGKLMEWNRADAAPRLQMQPASYLTRESFASGTLRNVLQNRASDK